MEKKRHSQTFHDNTFWSSNCNIVNTVNDTISDHARESKGFQVYLLASLYDNARMARVSVLSPLCLQLLSGFLSASYLPPLSQHKATPSSQRHVRLLHSLLADPGGRLWLERDSCCRWSPGKRPACIPGSPGAACRRGVYRLRSDQIPFAEHIIIFCYLQLNRSLPTISTPSTFQREYRRGWISGSSPFITLEHIQ